MQKDLRSKRISGPLSNPPFNIFSASPIGLVSQKEKNSYLLVHHLSYPDDSSINDKIDPELATVNIKLLIKQLRKSKTYVKVVSWQKQKQRY
jgi:hypothetical protein